MLTTLVVFLVILSILIFVHELGHFLVAKKAGIKVEEFGFGLPPRVWGKKIGETIYSLNLLPIGGFVRLYGENEEEPSKKENISRQFLTKPKKVRAAVAVAGVIMNFLLAVVVFSIIYTKLGIPTQTEQVKVVGIASSSPAEEAGLKENDTVLLVQSIQIKTTQEFIDLVQKYAGKEIVLEIFREKDNPCREKVLGAYPGIKISCSGENLVLYVTPRENPPEGEGPLGVAISNTEIKFYPLWQMPFRGAVEGIRESLAWASMIVAGIGQMLYKLVTAGVVPADVAGPVGIFQLTGQVAKTGAYSVLQFLGVLSIHLAIINILPIPALDGGRLLFIGIEAVTGRRVKTKVEAYIHQIGMIFLLLLILLITVNDLSRLNLLEKIKSIFSR